VFLDYIVSGANKHFFSKQSKSSATVLSCLSLTLSSFLASAMSSRSQSIVSRAGSLTETIEPIPVPTHYQGVYSVCHSVVVAQSASFIYLCSAPRHQYRQSVQQVFVPM
jgi:hypothetical protein